MKRIKRHILNLKSLLKISTYLAKPHTSAFMLLDCVIAISLCAAALSVGFGLLLDITPRKLLSYEAYRGILLDSRANTTNIIATHNATTLHYEVQLFSTEASSGEKLVLFKPIDIR